MKGVDILSKSNKEEREINEWKKMKSKGKKKYVWYNGVLEWGVFLAILWPIGFAFIDKGFSLHSLTNQSFIRNLIISFIFFPLAGYFRAMMMWKKCDEKYKK